MNPFVSVAISGLALVVSTATAWLTLLRKGTVRMTQPTVIYFGPDGGAEKEDVERKVFLRTLLYSTSKRGQIVESMFVRLRRGESVQTLNIWAYGDDRLARGSGLYVGSEGLACNHHFLPPADAGRFEFLPGDYVVQVFASLVGKRQPLRLAEAHLHLTEQQANALRSDDSGVYFDWGPDSQRYVPHVRARPKTLLDKSLFEKLLNPPA
jgi:hypothetical protein